MDVFLVYHLGMFKKSLNISFITCFCHFIELLIPYFETATVILLELNAGCHNRLLSVICIC